jgi:hypothetical protein
MNYFKDMVDASRERALALSHERRRYREIDDELDARDMEQYAREEEMLKVREDKTRKRVS